jgi:hypothetical protein
VPPVALSRLRGAAHAAWTLRRPARRGKRRQRGCSTAAGCPRQQPDSRCLSASCAAQRPRADSSPTRRPIPQTARCGNTTKCVVSTGMVNTIVAIFHFSEVAQFSKFDNCSSVGESDTSCQTVCRNERSSLFSRQISVIFGLPSKRRDQSSGCMATHIKHTLFRDTNAPNNCSSRRAFSTLRLPLTEQEWPQLHPLAPGGPGWILNSRLRGSLSTISLAFACRTSAFATPVA